ncbi:hypothetical protein HMI55_000202 [Coelomomyces lativittatus]|nr:hypothetical protein HMI56_005263 [Coelomomyces lativittatus]KAJ1517268.1 hypothetical protein HMI55_000202 [Coelomomyces lativittatus]
MGCVKKLLDIWHHQPGFQRYQVDTFLKLLTHGEVQQYAQHTWLPHPRVASSWYLMLFGEALVYVTRSYTKRSSSPSLDPPLHPPPPTSSVPSRSQDLGRGSSSSSSSTGRKHRRSPPRLRPWNPTKATASKKKAAPMTVDPFEWEAMMKNEEHFQVLKQGYDDDGRGCSDTLYTRLDLFIYFQ